VKQKGLQPQDDAVGVITYILRAGYPPFNGLSNEEVQQAIMRDVESIALFNILFQLLE
jgi:hypothetical protein